MNTKLKPCPFCGGTAKLSKLSSITWFLKFDSYYVECKTCCARSRISFEISEENDKAIEEEKDKVIEAWNRRVEK